MVLIWQLFLLLFLEVKEKGLTNQKNSEEDDYDPEVVAEDPQEKVEAKDTLVNFLCFYNMNKNKTRKVKTLKVKSFPKRIKLYSNPRQAQRMAHKYLGKTAKLYPARNPEKKYSIFDPKHQKWVNFGQMGYEDFTKHHDKQRRQNYLTRTKYMRGDWKNNRYSANNLSRHVLW